MATRRHSLKRKNRTKSRKMSGGKSGKKTKTGKKWMTAIDAASKTLEKTGSISAARESLRKQALFNARKLFGSV
jgi:hypothetical protein